MNKKLIKQLEGVGFVKAKTTLNLKVKGGFICDFFMRNRMLIIYNSEKVSKKYVYCTFEGILLLIKEHTGVDLAKKTKREEIEELKTGLKALVEKAEDSEAVFDARLKGYFMSIVDTVQAQEAKIESLEDAIKSQNEAVEDLKGCISPTKRKYFLGMDFSIDAADALRYSVNQMIRKDVNKLIEQGDERILSKFKPIDTSKLKQAMKSMQDMCDKQASEMPAKEKKGFEVGHLVVMKKSHSWALEAVEWARSGQLFEVFEITSEGIQLSIDGVLVTFLNEKDKVEACVFDPCQLEHAPAESPKEPSITEVLENVLYWDTCPEEYKDIIKKHLKEDKERPKEKALEFGDPLECMVSKFHLKTGQKVIFLRVETPVPNNVRYIVSTESGLTYALRTNEVKLL